MDHLPAVLAAMYRAPVCTALPGTVRHWNDHSRRMALLQRPDRRRGVVVSFGGSGGAAPTESTIEVTVAGDRVRVDQPGMTTIDLPTGRLMYTPGNGALRTSPDEQRGFRHPGWLWAPRALIDAIDIDEIDTAERLERPVWRIVGSASDSADDRYGMFRVVLAGDRYRFEVDQATGVVLAMHVSLDTGEPLDVLEWTRFEADVPLDDDVFELALPAGERIRSANELQLEHLAREGVDTSGVDPDDDEAVAGLLAARGMRYHVDPLAQVVATGDPPKDEDAARAAIDAAFGDLGAREGDRLVNVQAGQGLAPYLDRAREGFPANLRADRVKFVSATEAVAIIVIEREDGSPVIGPQTMRAVVEDGRWKAERSSLTSLLGMAGVRCPPPES